jgi:UDP-2-acetamido-2-deoxy-ribo-hexuluronate aminotransferase
MIKIAPLTKLYQDVKTTLANRYNSVFSSDTHVDGPFTTQCADYISQLINRKHTVMTTSGTNAITAMLLAVGVAPGDEVICVNYSNPASVMPIKLLGAVPVFVDINAYGCMDLTTVPVTAKTRAIIVTGLYGDSPDWDCIKDIGLPVLNDSAQCLTTLYKHKPVTQYGDITALSFAFNKNAPVFGTYGSVSTDDKSLFDKLKTINANGYDNNNSVQISHIGINGKTSEDKSAQCLTSLEQLDVWQTARTKIAEHYCDVFGRRGVSVRSSPDYSQSNHHKYCIFTKDKKRFVELMHQQGIECSLHYTYDFSKYKVLNPNTITYARTNFYVDHAVNIPCHQWLEHNEIEQVAETVCEINDQIGVPDIDSLYS